MVLVKEWGELGDERKVCHSFHGTHYYQGLNWWSSEGDVHLEHVHVTLFEERVFQDVIKLSILRCNHAGLIQVLTPMMCVFSREEERHSQKGETEAKTEAVMLPRAKECPDPPESGRGKEVFFFLRNFEKSVALLTLWCQTSGLQNCERVNFHCFKPPHLWSFVMVALGNKYRPDARTVLWQEDSWWDGRIESFLQAHTWDWTRMEKQITLDRYESS